jgi:hypothetical protein
MGDEDMVVDPEERPTEESLFCVALMQSKADMLDDAVRAKNTKKKEEDGAK